jgi:hypothetical protein
MWSIDPQSGKPVFANIKLTTLDMQAPNLNATNGVYKGSDPMVSLSSFYS